jgi:hypothetical protein
MDMHANMPCPWTTGHPDNWRAMARAARAAFSFLLTYIILQLYSQSGPYISAVNWRRPHVCLLILQKLHLHVYENFVNDPFLLSIVLVFYSSIKFVVNIDVSKILNTKICLNTSTWATCSMEWREYIFVMTVVRTNHATCFRLPRRRRDLLRF